MERFINPQSLSSNISNLNQQEDPYSIELDRPDISNLTENKLFMEKVIEAKKSLLDNAKLMRNMLNLDQLTTDEDFRINIKLQKDTNKNKQKPSDKDKKSNDDELLDDVNDKAEENKFDEEAADEEEEEEQIDDNDEVNIYRKEMFILLN